MVRSEEIDMTVGFIGLGAIGRPIAEHVAAHTDAVVFDIREEAVAPFRGKAGIALSPADVAGRSDVVIGCLSSLQAYRSAIIEQQGIFGGRAKIYLHIGTTGSELAHELEAALATHGIVMVDAPMTGGTPRAREGTLTTMVSGPRAAVEQVMPVLQSYSSRVVNVGERVGAAQTMKVINNMLSAANLAIAAEGLVMGVKAGLDPDTMLELINAGTGQNSATLTKLPNNVLTGRFDYGGSMAITIKDLGAFMHEAESLSVETPLGAMVQRAYQLADKHEPSQDMTEVVRPMEQRAGVEVRGKAGRG
jgi:3-hydroxyisobutyrate dehydrogenase-like beta-hydroxyacid dehydrogenase